MVVSYDEPHDASIAPFKYRDLYTEYGAHRYLKEDDDLQSKPEEQGIWAGELLDKPVLPVRARLLWRTYADGFGDRPCARRDRQCDPKRHGDVHLRPRRHAAVAHRLRGTGPAMYQEITNVPFLVRERGKVPHNIASNGLVSQMDVAGTLIEYFGVPLPASRSKAAACCRAFATRTSLHVSMHFWSGVVTISRMMVPVAPTYRCITDRVVENSPLLTSDELNDLESDPGEEENLITTPQHGELRNRLHDAMLRQMDLAIPSGDTPGDGDPGERTTLSRRKTTAP